MHCAAGVGRVHKRPPHHCLQFNEFCGPASASAEARLGGQITVAKDIIAKEGFGGMYRGLSAGLLRQATYTTARLGIFNNISTYLKEANHGKVTYPRRGSASSWCGSAFSLQSVCTCRACAAASWRASSAPWALVSS